jgi:hypothetical protein
MGLEDFLCLVLYGFLYSSLQLKVHCTIHNAAAYLSVGIYARWRKFGVFGLFSHITVDA